MQLRSWRERCPTALKRRKEKLYLIRKQRTWSREKRVKLQQLMKNYCARFKNKPGCAVGLEIQIETGDAYPLSQPPYRMPANKQKELEVEVKILLENGLIRPSGSPWASPVVLVAKTDGGVRLCVDYRRLNGITKPDPFPLPRIDELIDGLARARYLTTRDLARGYHQVPVHQDSISKTAVITPKGKWEYLRMPFGLKNAPSSVPANDECGTGRHGFLRCRLH